MTSLFFVVWVTTAGVVGFRAEADAHSACALRANPNRDRIGEIAKFPKIASAQVFKIKDPGFRYAIGCIDDRADCGFPGYLTDEMLCEWLDERKVVTPGRWEMRAK